MGFSEEKIFKFGFYCLNALICIYSLYMFVIQKGASMNLKYCFVQHLLLMQLCIIWKEKTSILKRAKFRGRTFVLSLLTFEQL